MDAKRKAELIIDTLKERGGFDHWWHDIDQEDKEEILEKITKIVKYEHGN